MKSEEEKPPETPVFTVDNEMLLSVFNGLDAGDISDCKTNEVKHACGLLASTMYLEELRPGFVGEMFSEFIPYFVKMNNRLAVKELAQKKADSEGIGDEWRAAMEAANHPKQKDLFAHMVDIEMKSSGVNQAKAIRVVSKVMKREEEDVRRNVNRQNSRIKKAKPDV